MRRAEPARQLPVWPLPVWPPIPRRCGRPLRVQPGL